MLERLAAAWFVTWGREDVRSLWLACALYAIERPALTFQPQLLRARAAAWIAATTSGGAVAATTSKESPIDRVPSGLLTAEPRRGSHQATAETGSRPLRSLHRPAASMRAPRVCRAMTVKPAASTSGRERAVISRAAGEDVPPRSPACAPRHRARGSVLPGSRPAPARHGRLARFAPRSRSNGHARGGAGRVAKRLDCATTIRCCAPSASYREPLVARFDHGSQIGSLATSPVLPPHGRMGCSAGVPSGRVAFTDTHVDVLFDLGHADIRVRRAGLDIDPGWVPWLGRVVRLPLCVAGGDSRCLSEARALRSLALGCTSRAALGRCRSDSGRERPRRSSASTTSVAGEARWPDQLKRYLRRPGRAGRCRSAALIAALRLEPVEILTVALAAAVETDPVVRPRHRARAGAARRLAADARARRDRRSLPSRARAQRHRAVLAGAGDARPAC